MPESIAYELIISVLWNKVYNNYFDYNYCPLYSSVLQYYFKIKTHTIVMNKIAPFLKNIVCRVCNEYVSFISYKSNL